MTPTITRDANLCIKCGTCVLTCGGTVYAQESKDSIPEVINPGSCISCGYCVAICPKNAIVHSEFPEGYVKPVNAENMPSSEEVLELLRTRRSIRVFKDRLEHLHVSDNRGGNAESDDLPLEGPQGHESLTSCTLCHIWGA
jgi:ferredoxin